MINNIGDSDNPFIKYIESKIVKVASMDGDDQAELVFKVGLIAAGTFLFTFAVSGSIAASVGLAAIAGLGSALYFIDNYNAAGSDFKKGKDFLGSLYGLVRNNSNN